MAKALTSYLLQCAGKAQADLLASWLAAGNLTAGSRTLPLSKAQRYSILKILIRTGHLKGEQKNKLIADEQARDFSDYDTVQKNALDAADPNGKDALWRAYVRNEKHFPSMLHFKASVQNFYNHEDEKQCAHFADKFFDCLKEVFETKHRDYAEAFFINLSPTFLGQDAYRAKLHTLLQEVQ